jgi:membrane protease subunit (stomatin/prohibitin family)
MPLMFFGFVFSNLGFMGSILRYHVRETAPVGKDAINYMAEGTQEGVKTMARAVGSGLAEGMGAANAGSAQTGETEKVILCHKCNSDNSADAKFCSNCGAALTKSKRCSRCDELNDPDARFCDNCGSPMQS